MIKNVVNEVIDAVEPRGQMDVIRDLAFPLPLSILGSIMGVPNTDQDRVKFSEICTLPKAMPHINAQ